MCSMMKYKKTLNYKIKGGLSMENAYTRNETVKKNI